MHGSRGRGHEKRADDDPRGREKELGIEEGTRLKVEAVEGKVVFTKIPSVFDLAGTSKGTVKEAFNRLDAMREEEG